MGSLPTRVEAWWSTIKSGVQQRDGRAANATLAQRFVHGSFWSLIGAVGAQGFTLVASVFTARVLGKEAFGQFSFLQGTVVTAATFAGFGLGLTATRYVAAYRQEDPQRAGSFIHFVMTVSSTISALAAALMAVGAPYLATHVFHSPPLAASIRWAALYLFCVTVNGVQTGILAGFESFRAIANVNITRGVSTFLLTLPLAWCHRLEGAVLAMALAGTLAYGMSLFQVASILKEQAIPKVRTMDWHHAKVLWSFALPVVLGGILVSPVTWLASFWLSRQPNGYGELGLFGAANQWRMAVSFIPAVLSQPILPLLASLAGGYNRSFNRLVIFSALLNGGAAVVVSAAVVLAAPVIAIFYGKSYIGLYSVLIPLLAAGIISCACGPIGNALASQEKMWVGFLLNLVWACCLLTSAYVTTRSAGARGLAYAFLAAYLVHLLTTACCVFRFNALSKRTR
jgi:O-antigen/teichoic acid export membrane protein